MLFNNCDNCKVVAARTSLCCSDICCFFRRGDLESWSFCVGWSLIAFVLELPRDYKPDNNRSVWSSCVAATTLEMLFKLPVVKDIHFEPYGKAFDCNCSSSAVGATSVGGGKRGTFSAKRSASSESPTDSTFLLFTTEKLRSDSRSSFQLRLEDDATLEAEEPNPTSDGCSDAKPLVKNCKPTGLVGATSMLMLADASGFVQCRARCSVEPHLKHFNGWPSRPLGLDRFPLSLPPDLPPGPLWAAKAFGGRNAA